MDRIILIGFGRDEGIAVAAAATERRVLAEAEDPAACLDATDGAGLRVLDLRDWPGARDGAPEAAALAGAIRRQRAPVVLLLPPGAPEILRGAAPPDPRRDALGQPVGDPLPGWAPPPTPPRSPMEGRFCRLEPLEPGHADALHDAFSEDREGRLWTYLPDGPHASAEAYRPWVADAARSADPLFFAILAEGRPMGHASFLRIAPAAGSIEVGFIALAPGLQRSPAATEAMHLMMARAFGLGYRRYEWKCDALNAASRRAALRLGFTFEGVFRQATTYKGRNRDTAWYSVIDAEWPALDRAFTAWLEEVAESPGHRQKTPLGTHIARARAG